MDLYTFALSIAYTNKAIKTAGLEGFKVQVETTRDILETVGEEKTFYFLPKVVSKPQNGYDEYIYVNDSWELMGGTDIDLSGYMTLAPLNPTAQEIEAMPSGQLYGNTVNHKGIIKGGQEFYDRTYVDNNFKKTYISEYLPPYFCSNNGNNNMGFNLGDKWVFNPPVNQGYVYYDHREYVLTRIERTGMYGLNYTYIWIPTTAVVCTVANLPTTEEFSVSSYIIDGQYYAATSTARYSLNDAFLKDGAYYVMNSVVGIPGGWQYQLRHLMSESEVNALIPTVPTNISAFTNDSGYLTLSTLPIYNGGVE